MLTKQTDPIILYRQITQVINNINKQKPKVEDNLKKFLEHAASIGWLKENPVEDMIDTEDNYAESMKYINSVSVSFDSITKNMHDGDIVMCPIILSKIGIPDSTLEQWATTPMNLDICVVFGSYVVITDVPCIKANTKEEAKNIVANTRPDLIVSGGKRQIRNYGFFPLMPSKPKAHKFFQLWTILTK
jgi:hypothetical protein